MTYPEVIRELQRKFSPAPPSDRVQPWILQGYVVVVNFRDTPPGQSPVGIHITHGQLLSSKLLPF